MVGLSRLIGLWIVTLMLTLGTAVPAHAASVGACQSLVPAAIGGPVLAKDREEIVLRWLGTANYELDYKGHTYLLDTYYDRGPRTRSIGFTPAQVKKATAIFIGHAHFDHISDVGSVAAQTGAKVVGAPITIETAEKLGVPASQTITVAGGETLHFPGVTVDAALARHSVIPPELFAANGHVYDVDLGPATPEQAEQVKALQARGTFAPDVITKGTMAYAFTFDTGFKLLFLDSAGPVTDGDRALAQKIGPVDVAIIAYQGHPVAEKQIAYTLPLIKLFQAKLYLPAHHDADVGAFVDLGLEPLFQTIRDTMPGTKYRQVLYREPVCLNIAKHAAHS